MNVDLKYMKVLIVEDDEHVANMIKVVLMAFCVENVHVACCYDDAVDILSHEPIDCVFVDYMMSPVGGIKLIEYIRRAQDQKLSQLPIILCTVYTDFDKIVEARDAGVSEILAKPVTPMTIFNKTVAAVFKPRPFISALTFKGPDRRRRNLPLKGKPERRISNGALMEQATSGMTTPRVLNA